MSRLTPDPGAKAAVAQSAAQLHDLERTWVPQFTLEGSASAAVTGAETDDRRLPGLEALEVKMAIVGHAYLSSALVPFVLSPLPAAHAHFDPGPDVALDLSKAVK